MKIVREIFISSTDKKRNVEKKIESVCRLRALKICLLLCSGINIQAYWNKWEKEVIWCQRWGNYFRKICENERKIVDDHKNGYFISFIDDHCSENFYLFIGHINIITAILIFFLIIMNISLNDWLVSSLSYKRRKTVFEEKMSQKGKSIKMKRHK